MKITNKNGDVLVHVKDLCSPCYPKGRADTIDKKIAFLLRLFDLWRAYPSLRFGQIIEAGIDDRNELFFIEDEQLINTLEKAHRGLVRWKNIK
jgi:hypothetical protein